MLQKIDYKSYLHNTQDTTEIPDTESEANTELAVATGIEDVSLSQALTKEINSVYDSDESNLGLMDSSSKAGSYDGNTDSHYPDELQEVGTLAEGDRDREEIKIVNTAVASDRDTAIPLDLYEGQCERILQTSINQSINHQNINHFQGNLVGIFNISSALPLTHILYVSSDSFYMDVNKMGQY